MEHQDLIAAILNSPELCKIVSDLAIQKKTYNPDKLWSEDYYFYGFINEFVTGNQFYGANWKKKVDDELLPALFKVIRIVETGRERYVILKTGFADKTNPIDEFITVLDLNSFKRKYGISHGCYYTISHKSTKGGKMGEEKIWLFQSILENPLFRFRQMDWIPCTPLEEKLHHKDIFNIFTGFQAKVVDIPNEDMIKPFLDHIRMIWANDNFKYYEYIMNWLATSVQFPRKRIPVLVLSGLHGVGKVLPIKFLAKKVFGNHCTAVLNNLDEVLGNFNNVLANKFMIYIAETDNTQIWNKINQFKSKIADERLLINPKYANQYQITNHIHWVLLNNTNNFQSELGDQKCAVFQGSEIYMNDPTYYQNFHSKLTDEMADHLYSYLLQMPITSDLKIRDIEIRQEPTNLPNPVQFWNDLTFYNWKPVGSRIPIDILPYDASHYIISKQDLYFLYKQWCILTEKTAINEDWFYRHLSKHNITCETVQHNKIRYWKMDKRMLDRFII